MYVGPMADLPQRSRQAWAQARATGYEQLIATAQVRDEVYPRSVVAVDDRVLASFERADDRLVSQLGIVPALSLTDGDEPARLDLEFFRALMLATSARSVYFPLLSATAADRLAEVGARVWSRRPTPVVDWSRRGEDLAERVSDRLGSRAGRRWRRFRSSGLGFRCVEGEDAVQAVLQVESRSWKHQAGIGLLHTPELLAFYLATLRRRLTTLQVVSDDGGRVVAYRLDAVVGGVLACLKWSYDDEYKSLSPGFNLLTTGLVTRWQHTALEYVDLAGSPDPMKLLLATSLLSRRDAAWPDDPVAVRLQSARQDYDASLAAGFDQGHGYRALWTSGNGRPGQAGTVANL